MLKFEVADSKSFFKMLNFTWSTCKTPRKANAFKSEIILSHSSASVTIKYSFVPNCWEEGGGGLAHSVVINKWTWKFFSQNLQFDRPLQLGAKEYCVSSNTWDIYIIKQKSLTFLRTHYTRLLCNFFSQRLIYFFEYVRSVFKYLDQKKFQIMLKFNWAMCKCCLYWKNHVIFVLPNYRY